MVNYVKGTMIATAAVATNLQEMSRRLDKADCGGMFTAALSATGNPPATHYISSGLVPQAYADTLTDSVLLYTRAKKAWEDDGDVFPYTQTQVTNQLALCTIRGAAADPFALMTQLGLKQIGSLP